MESRNHFLNGAYPKSLTSRKRKIYIFMKNLLVFVCLFTFICFSKSYGQKLTIAVSKNNLLKAENLIKEGANVNEHSKRNCFPLMYAIWNKNVQMAELLLKNGAKFDTCPNPHPNLFLPIFPIPAHLYIAIKLNQPDMVKLFYEYKCDIAKRLDGRIFTSPIFTYPIIEAAEFGCTDIFNFLLEKGVDVNVKDVFGKTALMYSCETNNPEITSKLLQKGCSVSDVSKIGYTPLMYAAQVIGINSEILDSLKSKGADLNYTNVKNETAFSISCVHNNRFAALYLLEHGVEGKIIGGDSETNARMNLFLGEHFLAKGDLIGSKSYYAKAKELYNASVSEKKKKLANVNAKRAGNFLLEIAAAGVVGGAIGAASGGQLTYVPNITPSYLIKDKDQILVKDYQISEWASLDEQKLFCKNKIQQFEMSIRLVDGIIACIEKGLTGEELNACIDNIQLTKN